MQNSEVKKEHLNFTMVDFNTKIGRGACKAFVEKYKLYHKDNVEKK